MFHALIIAEAIGATGAFCWLAFRYDRTRAALKHANWRAERFESMLDRKVKRASGVKLRDEKGRFA